MEKEPKFLYIAHSFHDGFIIFYEFPALTYVVTTVIYQSPFLSLEVVSRYNDTPTTRN